MTLCEAGAPLLGLRVSNIHVSLTGSNETATPGTSRIRRPPERGMLSSAPRAWPVFFTMSFPGVASESEQSLRREGVLSHTVWERAKIERLLYVFPIEATDHDALRPAQLSVRKHDGMLLSLGKT